jgi:DUF4097 and DUF4098 domain-containing protein YvlB
LKKQLSLTALAGLLVAGALAHAADTRKETRLDLASGGTLTIVDNYGSVTLHSGPGKQVIIASVTHSAKVEADQNVTADKHRAEVVVHALSDQKPTPDEARVDYDITVPAGIAVDVTTANAPISADGLSGDLNFSSDTGRITVRNVAHSHVHVRGITAPVSLTNFNLAHLEVTSSGGAVEMVDVSGPKVSVGTTSGDISYRGDCSGAGQYNFTTHSGAIDVVLPETASFDLSARSINGTVQNDFPLTQKSHTSFVPQAGRSFAGTSNSGSSSVELQSFSGRIRVKKQ